MYSIHKTCQILSTFISHCHCLHLHSQCLHLPHSHTSSLPFHNISSSSSVPFTALDILHFLKPCTVTSGDMCCHAVMIHTDLNNAFIFLGLWIYLNPWRFTIFSTAGVSGVENLHTCFLDFYVMHVVRSHLVHGPFYGFNLWISPGVIFEPCS